MRVQHCVQTTAEYVLQCAYARIYNVASSWISRQQNTASQAPSCNKRSNALAGLYVYMLHGGFSLAGPVFDHERWDDDAAERFANF